MWKDGKVQRTFFGTDWKKEKFESKKLREKNQEWKLETQ